MILLNDQDVKYPSTAQLPKPTGSWVLCKLVQYPLKDDDGRVIEGEWRQPVFSSLFANTVKVFGKYSTQTSWITGQMNQSRDGRKVQSISLMDFPDDEILQLIADGNVFIYANTDETTGPLSIADYTQLLADTNKAVVTDDARPSPSVATQPNQAGVTAG